MRKLCKTCYQMRHDTAFRIVGFQIDTSKCNLCENPNIYKDIKEELYNSTMKDINNSLNK